MAAQPLTVHIRDGTAPPHLPGLRPRVRRVGGQVPQRPAHLSVRCRCGHVYNVLLDFRRHFRNPPAWPGPTSAGTRQDRAAARSASSTSRAAASVSSVSGRHRIEPGQKLQVEFQLTDRNRTVIKKQAVVRTVQENTVGCEFLCAGELDKALGFFLQG